MRDWDPRALIGIGFVLVVTGAVVPFLMLMHMIKSTIFLNFFSYIASFSGLMLGVIGAAFYIRKEREKKKKDE